jgi:uncharacterized membrane protein YfcA
MTIFIGLSQIDAEATSLLMIVFVGVVGAYRQATYGNIDLRAGLWIGALSPVGVLLGVVIANSVSERLLQLSFAALALYFAWRLARHALVDPD